MDLHKAIRAGDLIKVEELVDNGFSVTELDIEGVTPLHSAVRWKNRDIFELILFCLNSQRANIAPTDRYGRTPLHYAAGAGDADIVETLLKATKDPTKYAAMTDYQGATALHYSTSIEAAKALMNVGAKINGSDDGGWTVLHWAAAQGSEGVLRLYLDTESYRLDFRDREDSTALDEALMRRKVGCASVLSWEYIKKKRGSDMCRILGDNYARSIQMQVVIGKTIPEVILEVIESTNLRSKGTAEGLIDWIRSRDMTNSGFPPPSYDILNDRLLALTNYQLR
jgi:hypothetical protein